MDYDALEKRGLLINPDKVEDYLSRFPNYEEEMKKDLVSPEFWKDKRVLITGISGFVGSHLSEKLLELGADVHGIVRRHSTPEYPNITHIINKLHLVEGNLWDFDSIFTAFDEIEPEVVFHLGAQSFVPTSFRCPIETYETNVVGTGNLLEAARRSRVDIKQIHIAGSSEEYGMVREDELPIKEDTPLRPQSPYGVSKVATELVSLTHFQSYGTPVKVTRAFNHTGPRRGLQFVSSVISRQIARAIVRGKKTITIGDPRPVRDFTDVRDMVQGYLLVMEKAKMGEVYNLGQGIGITIENLAKLAAKISDVDIEIEIDKTRFRPAEVKVLICDSSKAREKLDFRARIPLTKALSDNIEFFKSNPHLLDVERN